MNNDSVYSVKLEKYDTRNIVDKHVNGSLTVIWRDWDNIIKNQPKMVYITSVKPREIKGPHIHTKRTSHFVCIHGKIVFVIKDKQGKYIEFMTTAEEPKLICIPKNIASAHMNLSNDISHVLTLADIAWRPNDQEMKDVSFDDYDWSKWKKL